MVTPMTEQPGHDPDDRQGRPRQNLPGSELLTDFQRWLLRSSARSMRKELTGQVRKTLGGGRPESTDVWDMATTEIPPEVGESPECQWCPVCRAARRMRDSGPGLGGQLSGAGDVVASAASDVIGMIDSLLAKAGGNTPQRDRNGGQPGRPAAGAAGPVAATAEVIEDVPAGGPADDGATDQPGGETGGLAAGQDQAAANGAGAADPWREATAADGSDGQAGQPDEGHGPDSRG